MNTLISDKLPELSSLCAKRRVRRLALFGSATSEGFVPDSSDIDFIVEFEPMNPKAYADNYFGLLEDLECLFGVAIDLVEYAPIKNPYFKKEIDETRIVVYEAA
jgi:predicted nucleotidyltransferase